MNEQSLPQNYRGYSTKELLEAWDKSDPTAPKEQVLTAHRLLAEYRLAPLDWSRDKEQRRADLLQARKLLAPYGIDPAPWADSEGNRLPGDSQTASS